MAEQDVRVPSFQIMEGEAASDSILLIKELGSNVSQVPGLLELTSGWLSKEGDLAGFAKAVISAQGAACYSGMQSAAAIT